MKKTTVIVGLGALTVGLAIYCRAPKAVQLQQPQPQHVAQRQVAEISNAVPALAGPVAEIADTGAVIHDKGASVSMMPATSQPTVFVPDPGLPRQK